jgi:hypothetical protein
LSSPRSRYDPHWINGHFAAYPNNQMAYWPVPWYVIDEERGWILCEWRNRMRDPGNGMVFEEKNYTRLKYAGNIQWSFEEVIYNPLRMRTMIDCASRTRVAKRRACRCPHGFPNSVRCTRRCGA